MKYPGQINPLDILKLTDRQIVAAYYPDRLPAVKPGKRVDESRREMFWRIGEYRGMTDTEIRRAWLAEGGKL